MTEEHSNKGDYLSEVDVTVNLREKFPLAGRAVFQRGFSALVYYGLLLTLLFFGQAFTLEAARWGIAEEILDAVTYYVFWGGLFLVSVRLLYEEFYHALYYYGVEADHLVVSTGVFLKQRSSLHVTLTTDVYLERSLLALLFLTYRVQIATPSPESVRLATIDGLSRKNAVGLQDFFTDIIDKARLLATVEGALQPGPTTVNRQTISQQTENPPEAVE